MDEKVASKLKDELVRLVVQSEKLTQQKKDEAASFNEQLKICDEKISLLAGAINSGNLGDLRASHEFDHLLK